VLSQVAP